MDAFAQLALMAKAKLVFESESTFLSFPALSPLSYPPERLKFMKPGGQATARDLADLSEFARITNQIPRGVLAPVEEGEYLWDVYREVLSMGQVATGTMSAVEKEEYEHALHFLYTRGPDGLRRDSAALTAYKQCRDAFIKAQEEYKNRQFTAESSTDPAVKAQWQETEQPRLRDEVARAKQAWLTRGRRAEVEAAQQIESTYAARDPSLTWEEWKTSFISDIDTSTDTNNINFAMTGFSPYDLFESGNWLRFTVSNAEMTRLAREAPPELIKIFGSDLANPDIESVSFEYRSVAVTRPWLRPALFKSRFWRLGAAAEMLSDGADPPAFPLKGRCPAYISALVFARNVTIQRRQQPGAAPAPVENPRVLLELDPGILQIQRAAWRSSLVAAATPAVSPTVVLQPHLTPAAGVPDAALSPQVQPVRDRALHVDAVAQPIGARSAPTRWTRLLDDSFNTTSEVPAPPPEPAPSAPGPSTPTNEVAVLAFICKRVPRSPDPDPALTWR